MNLCSYGCNQLAKFTTKNGKYCCSKSYNSCPELRCKSSNSLKERYKIHPKDNSHLDDKRNWAKGKHAYNDSRIKSKYDPLKLFSYGSRGPHKAVLIEERGHKCESCHLSTWLNKPITLELDHIDGNNKNNIKLNLRLLCPNCHAQTPTWRRRKCNGKRAKSEQEMIDAILNSKNMYQCLKILGLKHGSFQTIERCRLRNNIQFGTGYQT